MAPETKVDTPSFRVRVSSGHASLVPYLTAAIISLALLVYGVVRAFVWDEGFHLLAAQLIQSGKRPYLDFCFPQTPLNTYWNAAWMSLFGDSWRVTHIAAVLLISATLFLCARWTKQLFSGNRWQSVTATVCVLLLGTNVAVFQFGPIAQAYAMCMFCSFAAFLLLERQSAGRIFFSGLFSGIGAGSSLLVAPVVPVFLGAVAIRKQHRWRRTMTFLLGCAIPFAPVFWLFAQNPQVTFFNVVQYQALFRRVNWGNATKQDADVLTSWVGNGGALLLALLFVGGSVYTWKVRRERRHLLLCLAASIGLLLFISTAHPTFARYYIVGAPFYTAIAAAGFQSLMDRIFPSSRPLWPTAVLAVILVLTTVRFVGFDNDTSTWRQYQQIAAKVASVTPHGGVVFADEQVYFLLHWIPPTGMEFSYSHKLSLAPAEAARYHIISDAELKKETAQHRFAVFQTCDDDKLDNWQLDNLYKQRQDFDDCTVFW